MSDKVIAFIGGGNMASSLIGGLIKQAYPADKIWVSDPSPEKGGALAARFQVHTTTDNQAALKAADVCILAVKPQIIASVLDELAASFSAAPVLMISIAAGVRTEAINKHLNNQAAIVRCMPNTPALVGSGATGLFANDAVNLDDKAFAESILRAVGITLWVDDEDQLDVITAISGSGPAYYFLFMESFQKIAIEQGLDANSAHLLTVQTALGSARMALESRQSLQSLREQVTSPGGTTEAALQVMADKALPKILAEAVLAAKQRAKELAKMFD